MHYDNKYNSKINSSPNCVYILQSNTASQKNQTNEKKLETSGYATWFTAGDAIRIAHYDVITRKLQQIEKNGDHLAP